MFKVLHLNLQNVKTPNTNKFAFILFLYKITIELKSQLSFHNNYIFY